MRILLGVDVFDKYILLFNAIDVDLYFFITDVT